MPADLEATLQEPPVIVAGGELEIRSEPERIIRYRIMRWGELGDTPEGWESFERGAFAGTDPAAVVLRLDHQDPAVARGISLQEREDSAEMEFRVARTERGDELLSLVRDGIYRGASVGFEPIPGGTRTGRHTDGRRINVRTRVNLQEVGATWRPVFRSAGVMEVRSEMPEATPAANGTNETSAATAAIQAAASASVAPPAAPANAETDLVDRLMTRLENLEERSRQAATAAPPAINAARTDGGFGRWAHLAIRELAGERVPDIELRALADIVTGTNLGVVPPAYVNEVIGPISSARAFLSSTRQLTAPDAGLSLIVPRIVTRPTAGKQSAEKAELTSTNTAIDTVTYGMETLGGAGDLSIQLLRRSSPSFLELYMSLLGEALAGKEELRALTALLVAGINDGGVFDPESPTLGAAFTNAMTATKKPPNRIWLSGAALAAFIDAKEPTGGGGRPLYPGLAQIGTISAGGPGGPEPMTLQPVVVPALDILKATPEPEITAPTPDIEVPDIIVGPSTGFAWAEDGSYTLQADNPGQAGRDVALVSMLWFAALYPGAFTGYTLS